MVQQIEDLQAELDAQPLVDLRGFIQVYIPLDKVGPPEGIAAAGADGTWRRCCKDGRQVGYDKAVRITVLIARSCKTIGPLIALVLPRIIRPCALQNCERTAAGITGDAANLPALPKAACRTPF